MSGVDSHLIYGVLPYLALTLAALVLDLNPVRLPRGDAVSMAGALLSSVVLLRGAADACFIGVFSLLVACLLGSAAKHPYLVSSALIARLASILVAAGVTVIAAVPLKLLIVPAVFLIIELAIQDALLSLGARRSILGAIRGSLSRRRPVMFAEISAAALFVVTYEGMGIWSLIPVVALLSLIRQSWSMLLRIRETYAATVGVIVRAAAAGHPELSGHSERVASIARQVASRLRLSAGELELLSYAALLHDIDLIGQDDAWSGESRRSASVLLKDVAFLDPVIPVLALTDGSAQPGVQGGNVSLLAYLTLVASLVDSAAHPETRRDSDWTMAGRLSKSLPAGLVLRIQSILAAQGYPPELTVHSC